MRFLHLSDLHLGRSLNGYPLLDDAREALWNLLDDAREARVDALLLAGDLYDSSQPSASAVRLLDEFLTEARDAGLIVLGIPGNHDSAERVGYASGLLASESVHLARRFDGPIEPVVLEDEHGPLSLWLLPFVRPAEVREVLGDPSIGSDYEAAVRAVVEGMAIDESQRNVLVAHQFVTAGGSEPERSDSETVYVGTAGNVDASVFDGFDYVALGHLHRPQSVGRDTVRYAGSPLKYSLSEVGHRKSGVLVDLGPKGEVAIDFLPVRAPHDLRRIKGPLEELLDHAALGEGCPEDYVSVVLTDEDVHPRALQRLREVYPRIVGLAVENTRTRKASDVASIDFAVGSVDPLALFREFFEEQNGSPLTAEQERLVRETLDEALSHQGGEVRP